MATIEYFYAAHSAFAYLGSARLMQIVKANSREPVANEGDIYALIACCEAGAARLSQMQPGSTVYFAPITPHTARRALQLQQRFNANKPLTELA